MAVKRQIFRPDALERYTRSRERSVLPRLVRPAVTRIAWVVALLLVLSAAASVAVRVPEFVTAPAVLIWRGSDPSLVIFLDPADGPGIAPGSTVAAPLRTGPARWVVQTVEPAALSPAAAAARLHGALPDAVRGGPAVLAWAVPEAGSPAVRADADGAFVQARVRTGERRAIALLARGRGRP